ncbi:hypothetical protein ACLOJK_031032 [Asimina triloba]
MRWPYGDSLRSNAWDQGALSFRLRPKFHRRTRALAPRPSQRRALSSISGCPSPWHLTVFLPPFPLSGCPSPISPFAVLRSAVAASSSIHLPSPAVATCSSLPLPSPAVAASSSLPLLSPAAAVSLFSADRNPPPLIGLRSSISIASVHFPPASPAAPTPAPPSASPPASPAAVAILTSVAHSAVAILIGGVDIC